MDISVAKVIKKRRIPYHIPARYNSVTCYRVWVDNTIVYDGVDVNFKLLKKKQVLNWIKKKYDYDVTRIDDHGTLYV